MCLGGGVTTNFGGVDVVPLITQKLFFAIWGLCWYNCFFVPQAQVRLVMSGWSVSISFD